MSVDREDIRHYLPVGVPISPHDLGPIEFGYYEPEKTDGLSLEPDSIKYADRTYIWGVGDHWFKSQGEQTWRLDKEEWVECY